MRDRHGEFHREWESEARKIEVMSDTDKFDEILSGNASRFCAGATRNSIIQMDWANPFRKQDSDDV